MKTGSCCLNAIYLAVLSITISQHFKTNISSYKKQIHENKIGGGLAIAAQLIFNIFGVVNIGAK